jgi:hypothetical protein
MDRLGQSPSGEDGSELSIYARAQKLQIRQPLLVGNSKPTPPAIPVCLRLNEGDFVSEDVL